jgi:lysophospholipase L1-like esterase
VILLVALVVVVAAGFAFHGYLANWPAAFHGGVLALAGALAALSLGAARRRQSTAVIALNTVICTLLAVTGYELIRPVLAGPEHAVPPEQAYSFDAARGDPEKFARWWNHYFRAWLKSRASYMMEDPRGVNPLVPRPGSSARFLEGEIRINQLGFRGPEISREGVDVYRIVALGESTTFGATIRSDDRPWPEMLQGKINRELGCEARVEVVNAGIPGWTIANNNARLGHDILPLRPDMILSYHGYNGFPYLVGQLPSVTVEGAPLAPERPSELLRRVEEAWRIWRFRRRFRSAGTTPLAVPGTELHATRYAQEYRSLAVFARHHGIRLVLCTFNLAADASSPEEVIRFYEKAFPYVRTQLLANQLHTRLVREIGERHELRVIDTSPGLNGNYAEAFIDIMHFTQPGRRRLVENLYAGIRELLLEEPRLRCNGGRDPGIVEPGSS